MPDPVGYGDPDDVLRSLRRYVAMILGSPPWTVRLQRVSVSDDERPVAVLEPGALTTLFARRAVNQGDVEKAQTITVVCYPVVGADTPNSAEAARQVAGLLDAGVSRGCVDATTGAFVGGPWRVPVYAFAGVPLTGQTRQGPSSPYMHASVAQTFSVRPIQDALDERRYTVTATIPLTWWQGGRVPPPAPRATRGLVPGAWSRLPPGG
jgi:hypothetical protein